MGVSKTRWFGWFLALAVSGAVSWGCVERGKRRRGWRRRQLTPADWKVIRQNILKKEPEHLDFKVNAKLEDKAVYLGLDVKDPVVPGKPVRIVHYWKCLKPMPGWRLFTHLNGPGGKASFINVDHVAIGGRYYVELWKPGEIIRDEQTITLPSDWPHKVVEVYVGIWKPGAGRLRVVSGPSDGQNRVLAARLKIGTRPQAGKAPAKPPRTYVVRKTKEAIKIDGRAEEAAWKAAPFTELFVNSMNGQPVRFATKAKLLWDDKNLYIYVEAQDPDVWSTIKKHDGALWTQEVIELMVDPEGDEATYTEFQVNPLDTTFDAYLPRYRQTQADWESGMKAAVRVEGTLNERTDKDQGWFVELAIPLHAVFGPGKKAGEVKVKPGDAWRANLYRMEVPKGAPRVAMAWSPPLKGDFHVLARFGLLRFADEEGKVPAARPAEKARPAGQAEPAEQARPDQARAGARPAAGPGKAARPAGKPVIVRPPVRLGVPPRMPRPRIHRPVPRGPARPR